MKSKNPETVAVHTGREPENNHGVVNPPVYHASTIIFDSYEDFLKAEAGTFEGTTYGRHGTHPYRLLEESLCELEGADKCLITNSGQNATAIVLSALLSPGDHILVTDSAYAPTRHFCDQELTRNGVEVTYYDPLIGANIKELIKKNTKVIFTESPGSHTFEVQDIPAISKEAHAAGAVVVLDNTWATPLLFRAFEKGVDVTIHAATKYIGGHSDLMMGIINCTKELYPAIKRTYKNFGICSGPDDIYLAQRGLRTLPTRLKAQEQAALELAKWLKAQKQVSRVLHPALPDCPGHEIWKRDFTGSSGLFSFVLNSHLTEKQISAAYKKFSLFRLGYSWGGFESLMIPVNISKVRTVNKWNAEGSAFRVSVGLENIEDLKTDLASILGA